MLGHGAVGQLALGQIPVIVTEFVAADPASFAYTASDVTLLKAIPIAAEPASFGVTAQAVSLEKGFAVDADPASFLLAGQPIVFPRSEAASFLWTGQDVGAKRTRIFSPILPASFALVGNNVSILVRELVTEIITESGTWVKDPLYDKSQPIKIECWGRGGNGAAGTNPTVAISGRGGGGAAWACTRALLLGAATLTLNVATTSGDTWASLTGSAPTSTSEGCLAKSGANASGPSSGGTGGQASSCIGDEAYDGGSGGIGEQHDFQPVGGGGGGGSAGPLGPGGSGGRQTGESGGGGGGGAGNGGPNGSNTSSGNGASGGNGPGNSDGGDGGTRADNEPGEPGGSDPEAGGGGGGGSGGRAGGAGGAPGGGGGGGGDDSSSGAGGAGARGQIRITYSRVAVVASVSAEAAAYLLSGQSVGIRATRFQFPDPAAFMLTGQDIIHRLGYYAVGDPASFTLTGNDVWVRRTRIFHVDRSQFLLSGQDVDWLWHRVQRPLPARFLLEAGGSIYLGTEKHMLATPAGFVLMALPVQFGRRLARQGVLVLDPQGLGTLFQSSSLTGQIVSDPSSVGQLFKPGW